ncbi:MAG TPA: hypothetical protein PLH03_00025 [Methylophilaceae bacterium]|nr:hypothetical protein [Methylophilaceae bacterium]
MKPAHQNLLFPIPAVLLTLACLAAPSFAAAQDSDEMANLQARRQELIKKCEANRGTDCEHEVDVELGADQTHSPSVYIPPEYDRTRPIRPVPRPAPRSRSR